MLALGGSSVCKHMLNVLQKTGTKMSNFIAISIAVL